MQCQSQSSTPAPMRRTFSSSPTVNSTGLHAVRPHSPFLWPSHAAVTSSFGLPSGAQLKCEPAQASLKQRRSSVPSLRTVKDVVCQRDALWIFLSNQSTERARKKMCEPALSFWMIVWQ